MAVDIECPRCKRKFVIALVVAGRIIECPYCGFETALTVDDLRTAQESRQRLRRRRD